MKKAKIGVVLALIASISLSLFGCSGADGSMPEQPQAPLRVVALSSSLAEIWLLAGGELVGTSSDTLERGFEALADDVAVVGTVKDPGLESILDLRPDFVILSADVSGHVALEQSLLDANISHYFAHVETFEDYLAVLELFCSMTGNTQMLEQNGVQIQAQIAALVKGYTPAAPANTYLLLRAHSSGGKVIADDHVVCDILDSLGAANIAAQNQSLLSDLSLEAILESDPDYIFVVTMGQEDAALLTLEQVFVAQPAWQKLTAVQKDRVHVLPKELFHYKPNAKWGEAYEMLIALLEA